MDQKQLQEKIALYYSKLPTGVQKEFSSMKWMDNLKAISKKYALSEEQVQTLGIETTLVLLSIIDKEEYSSVLKKEIKIEPIIKIIDEIDNNILKVVHPQISETFQNNANELVEEKYGEVSKIDERLLKLPQEVQTAINESDYQSKLYAIAAKHKLSINHMGALEEATTKVMIGMIHPDKYEAELQNTISIDKGEITEIVSEVNETVLGKVREILKSHWGKDGVIESDEDEVPIPPYAMPIIKVEQKKTESNIYADSGIEMVREEKSNITQPQESNSLQKENRIMNRSGINIMSEAPIAPPEHLMTNIETEKKLLEEVEHPADVATSIIGNKLSGATKSSSSTTDYSLPKVTKDTSASKPHDPYHEAIE